MGGKKGFFFAGFYSVIGQKLSVGSKRLHVRTEVKNFVQQPFVVDYLWQDETETNLQSEN